VERALAVAGASGTFNIADDEAPTVDALLRTTFERLGLPTRLLYIPRPIAMAAATPSRRRPGARCDERAAPDALRRGQPGRRTHAGHLAASSIVRL
jgi:hypothetical protein